MITLDRFEITKKIYEVFSQNAGIPFDLFVTDNGSKDKRIIEYFSQIAKAHYINKFNNGVATSFNMMMHTAYLNGYTHFCLVGNDILLPDNWLKKLYDTNLAIPTSGLSAIHCVEKKPETKSVVYGQEILITDTIFGTTFFNKKIIQEIGYFRECYNPYGLEDGDFNYRVQKSNRYTNYYLADLTSTHLGEPYGENDNGEYRQTKDASLQKNAQKFGTNINIYDTTNDYYVPLGNKHLDSRVL